MFDVGQYGSNNESGVLLNTKMGKKLAQGSLNFPSGTTVNGCTLNPLPYFLIGDEMLPLKTYLMRSYARSSSIDEKKSVFNYRHSKARRVFENAFGILLARWRIYNTLIQAKPENVEKIVLVTIALHNYLRQTDNTGYCPKVLLIAKDQHVKLFLDIGEGTPPLPVQAMKVRMKRSILDPSKDVTPTTMHCLCETVLWNT